MKRIFLSILYLLFVTNLYGNVIAKPSLKPQKIKYNKDVNIPNVIAYPNTVTIEKRRRINKTEKELIESYPEHKLNFKGRYIIQRSIFQCSKENIALMLKGLAPFGMDLKKVNLHHLKQQKMGSLVELTETEHTKYTKDLHRHVKFGSEITDRKSGFQTFKKQYWRSRAAGCIARGK